MAKTSSTVFLGFVDEAVSTKYQQSTDYTTNKIGGTPNFPFGGISVPNCTICGLKRPLLLQVYAPLDNSVFHRTLYLFGCLNPACSTQPRGWICLRSQVMERRAKEWDIQSRGRDEQQIKWCNDADDWGDDDSAAGLDGTPSVVAMGPRTGLDNDHISNAHVEENGNIILIDNYQFSSTQQDEDDESTSTSTVEDMLSAVQLDDDDANCNGASAALGPMNAVMDQASAEIEREESDGLVTIDPPVPVSPHRDLIALLKQTSALDTSNSLTLNSYFLFVEEELSGGNTRVSDHVQDLIKEYHRTDEDKKSPSESCSGKEPGVNMETYEAAAPAHGDLLFHSFLMKIQDNPGQVLRYSRNSDPLLLAPLPETPEKCAYCGGPLTCELQLLPTIIPSVTLECTGEGVPIEFGTVLIYTCVKSCWDTPDKSRQEVCIVQREQ